MAGLNTEYIEDGLRSIREIARTNGYQDIYCIANDLMLHIDEQLSI